jgi:hypothetical protein
LKSAYSDIILLDSQTISLSVANRDDSIQINRILVEAGAPVSELTVKDGLEDWFIQITKL